MNHVEEHYIYPCMELDWAGVAWRPTRIWTTSSEERILVEGEGRQPLHGLHQAVRSRKSIALSVWIPARLQTPTGRNVLRRRRAEGW